MDPVFIFNQGIKYAVLIALVYSTGLLVRHKGVKVNYTRKINHFALFFFSIFLDDMLGYEKTAKTVIMAISCSLLLLSVYIRPIRRRVPFIETAFLSFDRPEDRPHTLLWLATQTVAGHIVMIPIILFFSMKGLLNLIYIPIIINGVGDGLAEPVGIRFGRHTYEAYALFTGKKYRRSFEGSACVFIVSVMTILFFYSSFSAPQAIVALIAVPILMTLTEAFSPHTWDSPFIYGAAGLSLGSIIHFI